MATPATWRRRIALAAGALAAVGGVALALGPAAPWIVDHAADGVRAGRLGRLQLDGVEGDWLGALRARHLSVADDDGVWIEANNVALDWNPFSILVAKVDLSRVHADRVRLLRAPTLSRPTESNGGGPDLHIGAIGVDALDVDEHAVGEAARFNAALSLDLQHGVLTRLDLAVRRTDSDADRIVANFNDGPAYHLSLDAYGAAGGVLSRLIGAPEQDFHARAGGSNSAGAGLEHCEATVGDEQLLACDVRWTPERWSFSSQARLDLLPSFAELRRRIGATISITAEGAHAGAFTGHAQTPLLTAEFSGALAHGDLDGPLHFIATTQQLSAIAHESPFALGPAHLSGDIRQARGVTGIRATLSNAEARAFGASARFSGPVSASFGPTGFTISADFRAGAEASPLLAHARLAADMRFDSNSGRFSLDRASFESDAAKVDAAGWANHGDGEFSGVWRARKLDAFATDLNGAAAGQWRAAAAARRTGHVWTTTVAGDGDGIRGQGVVAQLLAGAPHIDAMLKAENGGVTVSHARIGGDHIRAGAVGRIVNGDADLALEASVQGPITIGAAVVSGGADVTGRLAGRLDRPALSGRAVLSSFATAGIAIEQPTITFAFSPAADGYAGHAEVDGAVAGQRLTANSDLHFGADGLQLPNLDARAGGLLARGDAAIGARGLSANLAVNGALDGLAPSVTGQVVGSARLTPENIAINAQLADATAGELRLRSASISATGPYNAIAAHVDLRGRLRQAPLTFRGNAAINAGHNAVEAQIGGSGSLAGAAINTRTPIEVRWSAAAIETTLDVTLADGGVGAHWTERGRALSGRIDIDDAPMAPLAAIWGETATGRIDGHVALANADEGLRGDADLRFANARFAGRQRGALNMHVTGNLEPSRLLAQIDATSDDGLVAHVEADAPVETSAAPIRIALIPQRRGRATWSIRGPAESAWAAARLEDQSLEGALEGEGALQFGEGYLAGDGHVQITDGRFEDKLTGITLANLYARLLIDQRGLTIDRFSATGPHGGSLTASGGSANPNEGRIAVNVQNMEVANRPEARARASGALTLAWQGLHATLSGELNILEANLDIASNPSSGIPTIDVVEINRPADADYGEVPAAVVTANASTDLDVRIRAPGRVYTRGRGVNAEWALNLRLTGTSAAPRIYGEARAVRGTLALSGQPFDIQDATITFDGDPLDARVDMTAQRDAPDLTATIRLTGTARAPEIALSSEPALPEDEILPQVLFGHSVQDLSPFEAAQLASSIATLSGRTSLDLVDAARAAAGLDRFAIRQDTNGGFLVSGGVYLTRGVYVEVARTGLGQAQTQVEWTIRPRFVLITSFLGNGDQRVSLRWRRESN